MEQNQYYGYIYKIIIRNENSTLNNYYYLGQHKCKKEGQIDNAYWGSGSIIKNYISKYGTSTLERQIICWAQSAQDLNNIESYYIHENIDDPLCINIIDGGYAPEGEYHWYNNGIEERYTDKIPGNNWKRGKIITHKKLYNNGEMQIYIDENKEIPEGFVKGSSENNFHYNLKYQEKMSEIMTGYKWYNNGEMQIYIKGNPPEGFISGMLQNEKTKEIHNKRIGSKYYNNGIKTILVKKDEEVPEGFVPGIILSQNSLNNMSAAVKGKKWYNNGKEQHLYFENEVPKGWTSGMLPVIKEIRKKISEKNKNKMWFNNNEVEIMCKIEDVPEGFVRGRLKRKNK